MEGLLYAIIIGGIAGWLAGLFLKGKGFGILLNILIGIVGAVLGNVLFGILGFAPTHIIGRIISATIGSVVFLILVGFLMKRRR